MGFIGRDAILFISISFFHARVVARQIHLRAAKLPLSGRVRLSTVQSKFNNFQMSTRVTRQLGKMHTHPVLQRRKMKAKLLLAESLRKISLAD